MLDDNRLEKGIACGGHWVIDRTKVIDHYPRENSLARILEETVGSGGCAYNVILDLAKFDPKLPLTAVGVIGDDENGDYIVRDCQRYPNIDLRFLRRTKLESTAYTDAYSSRTTGSRTFFSHMGTNRLFDLSVLDAGGLEAWLFHLGYLTLLDSLDREDPQFGRVSARFLRCLKDAGIHTSMDLVSTDVHDYRELVTPALKYLDILAMNDFEAERLTGIHVREDSRPSIARLREVAENALSIGSMSLILIHFPEGAYARTRDGLEIAQPALEIPLQTIASTAGAGDAFCAGVLYGLYRRFGLDKVVEFAVAAAGMSLLQLTTTGAMGSWSEVGKFREQFPFRKIDCSFTK